MSRHKPYTFRAWCAEKHADDVLTARRPLLTGGVFMVWPDGRILPPYAGSGRSHVGPAPHPRHPANPPARAHQRRLRPAAALPAG